MRVLVVGSKNWINYNEVMRNMTILIEDLAHTEDKTLTLVHTGLAGAENQITEYVGKVSKFMKQKGYTVKEEIIRKRYSGDSLDKATADFDMMNSGLDRAFVFIKSACKRSEYCVRILGELGVPTTVIREK